MSHTSQVIIVTKTDSQKEGSCNGCSRWIDEHGATKHAVTDIRLRSISVRLCNDCLLTLIEKLKS